MKTKRNILLTFALIGALVPSAQALTYDANVTPGVIFGDGNANGDFTVDQANGIELGLRGKLRFGATGQPTGLYNSNGDGTYSFSAGVAPTKLSPTAVWSFEWSINSNFDGNGGVLDAYTYLLEIDSNPSQGTSFSGFNPIAASNPQTVGGYWDHSMGTNSTTADNDVIATNATAYATNIHNNNVAQNSWQAHWFLGTSFDPTVDGTYDFKLTAYSGQTAVASTKMQIIVGLGGAAVPDSGMTLSLLGLSMAGLGALRRKFRK